MSHRLRRFFAKCFIVIGAVFLLVAVLANQIGLSHGSVSKSRIFIGLIGIVFFGLGLFRRRFLSAYTTSVILAANTVVLLIGIEFGALVVNRLDRSAESESDAIAVREVSETSVARTMYVGWKGRAFDGEAININEAGLRVTPSTDISEQSNALKLFTFGGSTMWGEGAADDESIAAFLQQKLTQKAGCPIRVTNFGQRAWVSTQSVIQLMLELQKGNVPDVVVFYDGYNETTAAYSSGRFGVPENFEGMSGSGDSLRKTLLKTAANTEIGRLVSKNQTRLTPDIDVDFVANGVVETYSQNIRLAKSLAEAYQFEVRFYWQPQVFTGSKPLTAEEESLIDHPWLPAPVKQLTTAVSSLASKLGAETEEMADISDCFDSVQQRIYLDPCHVVGLGNKLVAEAMMESGLTDVVKRKWQQQEQAMLQSAR